ncbi:MAG: adenylate kinase family protein [Thaumarchaeota archaeon]|nr:adenylate kinase family protein [Nitrososphaerota archaeon]
MKYASIGITGTPGTGKKTVGMELALILGYEPIILNDLIIERGYVLERDDTGIIPDIERLRGDFIGKLNRKMVIIGHLLPQVFRKRELSSVIVLRCDPDELLERYSLRGYDKKKVSENIWSEIIDSSLAESIQRFGVNTIAEFNTTDRQPQKVAQEVADVILGRSEKKLGIVNWLTSERVEKMERL